MELLCLQCVFLPPSANKSYTLGPWHDSQLLLLQYISMSCSSLKQPKQTQVDCLALLPEAPSRDADGHDDVGDHLGEENKEEDEEVEGAVTPRREREEL